MTSNIDEQVLPQLSQMKPGLSAEILEPRIYEPGTEPVLPQELSIRRRLMALCRNFT